MSNLMDCIEWREKSEEERGIEGIGIDRIKNNFDTHELSLFSWFLLDLFLQYLAYLPFWNTFFFSNCHLKLLFQDSLQHAVVNYKLTSFIHAFRNNFNLMLEGFSTLREKWVFFFTLKHYIYLWKNTEIWQNKTRLLNIIFSKPKTKGTYKAITLYSHLKYFERKKNTKKFTSSLLYPVSIL